MIRNFPWIFYTTLNTYRVHPAKYFASSRCINIHDVIFHLSEWQRDYPSVFLLRQVSYTLWLVTMVKLIDLVETFIFVLRKKNEQVSFLHVYHHVTTILMAWLSTKYVAVAMTSFTLMLNCGVHVIMYTYYFLATFGPKFRRVLVRYKPILTIVQMVSANE